MLVVVMVAVGYAVYTLFFSPEARRSPMGRFDRLGELEKLVTEIAVQTSDRRPEVAGPLYIVAKASIDWAADPFLEQDPSGMAEKKGPKVKTARLPDLELGLIYTGYISLGRKMLAIINESDYEVGDILIDEDSPGLPVPSGTALPPNLKEKMTGETVGGADRFRVKEITTKHVVLEHVETKAKVILKMEETFL